MINLQLFAQEKTEEATPHRLQEVRRKGQVARSNDLNTALVLLVCMVFIYLRRDNFYQGMADMVGYFVMDAIHQQLTISTLMGMVAFLALKAGELLAPLLAVAILVGITANFMQVGFVFSLHPITPRLENLNPLKGLQRLLSRRSLVELLKGLFKVVVVTVVVWYLVKGQFDKLLMAVDIGFAGTLELLSGILFRVGMGALAVFLVVAIFDLIYQKREFRRSTMMTKQETKEEYKQVEGDPQVRSRLREKQRQFARHRMMHAVPEATVVITNPLHLAVALRYREEEGAPRVVAKGAGTIAQRIKEIAREHNVPIVEEPPVARALFYQLEIGQEIPVSLYQVVAEVLARVYRIKGRL